MDVVSLLCSYGFRFFYVNDKLVMTEDDVNYILVDDKLSFILPQTGEKIFGEDILQNSEIFGFHN